MVFGHLDEDEGEPVRVARGELKQSPRLDLGLLVDLDAPGREVSMGGANIAYLKHQSHGTAGRLVGDAGDLEQAAPEEERDSSRQAAPPFAIDRETESVLIEAK